MIFQNKSFISSDILLQRELPQGESDKVYGNKLLLIIQACAEEETLFIRILYNFITLFIPK